MLGEDPCSACIPQLSCPVVKPAPVCSAPLPCCAVSGLCRSQPGTRGWQPAPWQAFPTPQLPLAAPHRQQSLKQFILLCDTLRLERSKKSVNIGCYSKHKKKIYLPELYMHPELCCSSQPYSKGPLAALPAPRPDGSWVFCPDLPPTLPPIYSPGPLCNSNKSHQQLSYLGEKNILTIYK